MLQTALIYIAAFFGTLFCLFTIWAIWGVQRTHWLVYPLVLGGGAAAGYYGNQWVFLNKAREHSDKLEQILIKDPINAALLITDRGYLNVLRQTIRSSEYEDPRYRDKRVYADVEKTAVKILTRKIGSPSDPIMVRYGRLALREMEAMQRSSPRECPEVSLTGDVVKFRKFAKNSELTSLLVDAMQARKEPNSGAYSAQHIWPWALSLKPGIIAYLKIEPDQFNRQAKAGRGAGACAAAILYHQAILQMPESDAAAMFRGMTSAHPLKIPAQYEMAVTAK